MNTLSIDIETYSAAPLKKCGVYRYSEDSTFEILLFGYSADGGPVQVVDFTAGEQLPSEVLSALTDPAVTKWAFNAQFERVCLSRWLGMPVGEYLEPDSWRCTMVWAATLGLPLSLEGVGTVLGLEKQKLKEGKGLVRYFCTPAKGRDGNPYRHHPEDAPEKWERFKAYNLRDVETEMSIQQKLSRFPVPENIWDEYHLDQEINDRGIGVDMELVRQAVSMDARSKEKLTAQIRRLTSLANPNSVQQMKQWLADHGLEMDSLGKKEVAALLKTAPAPLSEVLLLRQQLAKSSVKKYTAMATAVCPDGRANVVHYGYIEKFIERLGERFNIREIAFDRWGAVQMVQNLEGMGFTVVPFGQGFKDMSPPTKELMKLVLEEKIAHGGHPVLRWMMDNIYIRTDPAGNIKADKEKSTEKIDGAIAMIMGLDRAIRCGNDSDASVYDTRGSLFI